MNATNRASSAVIPLDHYSKESMVVSPLALFSANQDIDVELRQPEAMPANHWHGQVEINIPFGGNVEYLINGETVMVQDGHIVLFWASTPHRLTNPGSCKKMGIINVPVHQFLSWPLNRELARQITAGMVLQSDSAHLTCEFEIARWEAEFLNHPPERRKLSSDEIGLMLRRVGIDGWHSLLATQAGRIKRQGVSKQAQTHVSKMLEYIAHNSHTQLTINDIADYVELNQNYAMGIFQRVMQLTIKQYITAMRINHARALLSDTDQTILDISLTVGLNSVSHFYEIFQRYVSMTPHSYRKLSRANPYWGRKGKNPVHTSEKGACDGKRPLSLSHSQI